MDSKFFTLCRQVIRLILLSLLILYATTNLQSQDSISVALHNSWRYSCLNEIEKVMQTHRYTDWQTTNARLIVERIDSGIFMQLHTKIKNSWPIENEGQLHILLYYVSGEVFSAVIQFVMVDESQCLTTQCRLEAGDIVYSSVESHPLQEWNKLMQETQAKTQDSHLSNNSFLMIASVTEKSVACKVVDIGYRQDYVISKWFFSKNPE